MGDEAKLFAEHFADQFAEQQESSLVDSSSLEDSYFSQQQQFVNALSSRYGEEPTAGAVTSSTLFVGDLSITCTENDLVELFSQFIDKNHIASAHILRCRTTGTSLCYGFVSISSADSEAETALIRRELHGMYLFGRNLKLRSAKADFSMPDPSTTDKDDALYNYDLPKISIYVKFQATHLSNNGHINEENIRQIFELSEETKSLICDTVDGEGDAVEIAAPIEVGDDASSEEAEKKRKKKLANASIIDISIRKLAVDRRTYCQYGYGFIFYHDNQQGLAAALHTLQSKGNIQATSAGTDGESYPIIYTLQSSKGLESYLNYIKGTGDISASADSVTQFLEKMRPPSTVGLTAPGEPETVFVRNPDSSFSPAYGQGLPRNRFPRPNTRPHPHGGFPAPHAMQHMQQQSQYHPRGAPNYQNPNALHAAQQTAYAPRPHPQTSYGQKQQLILPPQAPAGYGAAHGVHGYYPQPRPRVPMYPQQQQQYPRQTYPVQQQQQTYQQQPTYYAMQMQMQMRQQQNMQYAPRSQAARPFVTTNQQQQAYQQQARMYGAGIGNGSSSGATNPYNLQTNMF